jgi:hypothetical protein
LDDDRYKEVGTIYRFFLSWRHASFAGNLVVVWATLSLCITAYKEAQKILWIIPLTATPIGILFWMIDKRTRDLYHAAIDAGVKLEKEGGFFTQLCESVRIPKGKSAFGKVTQTAALNIFFIGSSVFFFILAVIFYVKFG